MYVHVHTQIQPHPTFHKIQLILEEALDDTWMLLHKHTHRHGDYRNTEMSFSQPSSEV